MRVCLFDAYGTLFDVTSPTRAVGLPAETGARLMALWRERQLQYTWLRTLGNAYADFERVTAEALAFALEALGLTDETLAARLLEAYRRLTPFAEAEAALHRLREAGMRLALLSNGTPAMLTALLAGAGWGDLFEAVLSADAVGAYKTSPAVYRLAERHFGAPAAAMTFISSNGWDAQAAAAHGFRVVWCNRAGQPRERLPGEIWKEIRMLDELPGLLEA
jgi:2-haloacid dehalogenase